MLLHPIPALADNYIWSLTYTQNRAALLVDPGDAKAALAYLETHQLQLEVILVTHQHPDHVQGIPALLERFPDCRVIGPQPCAYSRLQERLDDNERAEWRGAQFQMRLTPGHTLDHGCYFSSNATSAPLLFCGDTLFASGCGRLFEGSPAQMRQSLDHLRQYPAETLVCCAHEYTLANLRFAQATLPPSEALTSYIASCQSKRNQGLPTLPSTLQNEQNFNPFLNWAHPDVIATARHYARYHLALAEPSSEPDEVFKILRRWKDCFQ